MPSAITWEDVPALMADLRLMAKGLLRLEHNAQSIRPTELVLTALRRQKLKDQDWNAISWENRNHFFGAMYEAMRRALVDHARKRKTQAAKQRSRTVRIEDLEFNELAQTADKYPERIDALVLALDRLAVSHPEWVEVIKHRYFGGLTIKTIARIMAKGEKTIRRWWQQARLRLHREVLGILNGEETDDEELS